MNSNWRNRPTQIDEISKEIDYIISIDENGTSNLRKVVECIQNGQAVPDSERHFTVTACQIRTSRFLEAATMVMELKRKYWSDALVEYSGKKKRVCFHSRDIRNRKGAFDEKIIDYSAFILDLTQLIEDLPMVVYSSHINKERHVTKYKYPDPPYDLCMTFVLERILGDMKPNETCIIVLEARGKTEDNALLEQIKTLIDWGTRYCPPSLFEKIKGVYFNPKWSKKEGDQKSYWALEIADVCSYPIHKKLSYGTEDAAFKVVQKKIKNFPYYNGKGIKVFPPQ